MSVVRHPWSVAGKDQHWSSLSSTPPLPLSLSPPLPIFLSLFALLVLALNGVCLSGETAPSAERGWQVLRTVGFVPADFDQETFDELWKTWPEPLRSEAEKASSAERRRMAFSRYGLIPDPDDKEGSGPGLGYLSDGRGGWVMTCLACHAGKVAGQVIPGLPNTHYALATLTEEVRLTKLRLGKPLAHMDLGSLKIPLGETIGTTNSVIFGVALGSLRNPDMTVNLSRVAPKYVHHDMDAPPFWNVKKKTSLYCDGFAPKYHRPLMQFMLLPSAGPDVLKSWEDDFRDILAWIESVEPPKYPFEIDRNLAARGETIFNRTCAECHGTYVGQVSDLPRQVGNLPHDQYEQQTIPLSIVGTDPVRLTALTPEHRSWTKKGWLSDYGKQPTVVDPDGYVAPPLDGIWASAPYFHNGSVPTLWHVLHPDQRPVVWKRAEDGYDREKVGLEVTPFDEVPYSVTTAAERRTYFDTRRFGKKASGHEFPNKLNEEEKRAVLEYLKML